jgi:nitroreductase
MQARRSIRRYRPEPVPRKLIAEILDEARSSRSWRNTQSWSVWALTGAALATFKAEFTQKLLDGVPS